MTEAARNIREGEQIAEMVIYLGAQELVGVSTHRYTCKHFTGRDCAIYDDRPMMCRTYQEGGPCEFPGCTMRGTP